MRRRPHEDDGEQGPGNEPGLAAYGGPADNRRQRSGGAADDDVAGSPPLEEQGVDEDVEADGERQQRRREPVRREGHRRHRADGQGGAGTERRVGRDAPGGDGAVTGSLHERVDVAVAPHVDGARGAGADGDAKERRDGDDGVQTRRGPAASPQGL